MEQGLIGLDDDVSSVLTELKDIQILKGFETIGGGGDDNGGKGKEIPILVPARNKITLR